MKRFLGLYDGFIGLGFKLELSSYKVSVSRLRA